MKKVNMKDVGLFWQLLDSSNLGHMAVFMNPQICPCIRGYYHF